MHYREAFAAWLPLWGVPASYAVAIGYVVTDTIDKGFKAYAQATEELQGNESLPSEVNTARYICSAVASIVCHTQ